MLGVLEIGSGEDGASFRPRRDDFVSFFPKILFTMLRTGVAFLGGTYSSSGSGLTTGLVGSGARTYKNKFSEKSNMVKLTDGLTGSSFIVELPLRPNEESDSMAILSASLCAICDWRS